MPPLFLVCLSVRCRVLVVFRHGNAGAVESVSSDPGLAMIAPAILLPENVRRPSFPGLDGRAVFEIAKDRRRAPEPVAIRPRIFADRSALPYAYRVRHFQGKKSGRQIRGTSRDRKYCNQQQ
jgi:hypothetical protein